MKEYMFFLEHDGMRTYKIDESLAEKILAGSIKQAVDKFAKRKKMRFESLDDLGDQQFRVFLEKKRFLKEQQQLIYYIRQIG